VHPDGLSVREIAGQVGLKASTTHHLVNTLESENYVTRSSDGTCYLGHAVSRLYSAYLKTINQDRRLLDAVEDLAKVTQETAYVAGWQNGEATIQAIVEGSRAVRVSGIRVGYSDHTHARASGKVLLAYLSEQELDEYLSTHSIVPLTEHTVRTVEELKSQLKQVATQGYAIDCGEYAEDVRCVAAPVFSAQGKVVAALSISVPASRFPESEAQLIEAVCQVANTASFNFGYR
jgi:DNA-binding IclR family transcriptional regulator